MWVTDTLLEKRGGVGRLGDTVRILSIYPRVREAFLPHLSVPSRKRAELVHRSRRDTCAWWTVFFFCLFVFLYIFLYMFLCFFVSVLGEAPFGWGPGGRGFALYCISLSSVRGQYLRGFAVFFPPPRQ